MRHEDWFHSLCCVYSQCVCCLFSRQGFLIREKKWSNEVLLVSLSHAWRVLTVILSGNEKVCVCVCVRAYMSACITQGCTSSKLSDCIKKWWVEFFCFKWFSEVACFISPQRWYGLTSGVQIHSMMSRKTTVSSGWPTSSWSPSSMMWSCNTPCRSSIRRERLVPSSCLVSCRGQFRNTQGGNSKLSLAISRQQRALSVCFQCPCSHTA